MSRKIVDLIGQKFGKLTVVKRAEDKIEPNGRHRTMWLCQCDCGNIKAIQTNCLKKGYTQSCGCLKQKHANPRKANVKYKGLNEKRFNDLTVLHKINFDERETSNTLWECVCICGNKTILKANQIVNGYVKSCGCLRSNRTKEVLTKDLTDQKFGKLTVVKKAGSCSNGVLWKCKCECGNETIVASSQLQSNKTKSCGCLQKEIVSKRTLKDLSGKHFGKLLVLGRDNDIYSASGHPRTVWKCLCECGNIISVAGAELRKGDTKSCGCLKSNLEYSITKYLLHQNVYFESQKKFNDLKGIHNGLLSYDFYIPSYNLLIEAQGQQHYKPVKFGGQSDLLAKHKFECQQEHDKRKQEYAKENKYKLLEIPYWDCDKIEKILDEELKI